MASNDPVESLFAGLTQQLQSFGRVLGIHALGIAHARFNGDFHCDLNETQKMVNTYRIQKCGNLIKHLFPLDSTAIIKIYNQIGPCSSNGVSEFLNQSKFSRSFFNWSKCFFSGKECNSSKRSTWSVNNIKHDTLDYSDNLLRIISYNIQFINSVSLTDSGLSFANSFAITHLSPFQHESDLHIDR